MIGKFAAVTATVVVGVVIVVVVNAVAFVVVAAFFVQSVAIKIDTAPALASDRRTIRVEYCCWRRRAGDSR